MEQDARASAPLITLFERDDSIAVPLLSQLRMAGYDVRSARTPVELFDILGKNLVTLVLVDLGAATAGRREFWVALDAQRRGRAMQVLTFRYSAPASDLDLDFEPSARAIADVEIHGAHEFQRVIDAVRQRAPLHGPAPSAAVSYTPDGAIQPLGVALGLAPTPYSLQHDPAYGMAATPSQQPGVSYAPGYGPSYGGGAFGMAPLTPGAALGSPPSSIGGFPSMPSGGYGPQSYPLSPSMPPMQGYGAQMETTPFPPGGFASPSTPFGQPLQQFQQYPPSQPFGQPFPAQAPSQVSPFAAPIAGNPFAANPYAAEVETSPFAQPYGSNPFAQDMSAAPTPSSPFAQTASVNPFASTPQSGPSRQSSPSSWGVGSGGYVADAPGFAGWRTPDAGPDSFGSDPGAFNPFGAPRSQAVTQQRQQPSAPAFQDAWTPPDGESAVGTSALPEAAFQPGMNAWATPSSQPTPGALPPSFGTQERPWDAPRVSASSFDSGPMADDLHENSRDDDFAAFMGDDQFEDTGEAPTAAVSIPPVEAEANHSHPSTAATPTETALSSVLVEGALLTPGKLETLRGIQEMLASVDQPRKLGELAVMFKFLSTDQLLAALLVSRGLVSPQQIASLGRVKQEMAANGLDNDLETLLVKFNILPAEQLRTLRQELAS